MDIETLFGAVSVTFVIVIGILVAIAAVIYMVIKRKTDYDTKGIPKMREDPKEKEGSSENK